MEKISLESLARRLYINNCKLCLIELPEKKLYRTHNMKNGSFTNYYCKGIFIGYDGSSCCLFALLEDVYSQRDTGRRNVATYYCMSRDRANTIFQQLVSDRFLLEILKKKIMLPMVERFFCNNNNSNTLTY